MARTLADLSVEDAEPKRRTLADLDPDSTEAQLLSSEPAMKVRPRAAKLTGDAIQRGATGLEHLLNWLGDWGGSHAIRGTIDAALERRPLLEGAKRGVAENTMVGDMLVKRIPDDIRGTRLPIVPGLRGSPTIGLETAVRMGPGLAGDVVTDPLNLLGAGESALGTAVRLGNEGRVAAAVSGDAARVAAANARQLAAPARTLSEAVGRGEQGLLVAGKVVAPKAQAFVVKLAEETAKRAGSARAGEMVKRSASEIDKGLRNAFLLRPELRGAERNAMLQNLAENEVATRHAVAQFQKDTAHLRLRINNQAKDLGISPEQMNRIMVNVIERSKDPSGAMTPEAVTAAIDRAQTLFGKGHFGPDLRGDLRELVGTVNTTNAVARSRAAGSGIFIQDLASPLNYVTRQTLPSARRILDRISQLNGISRDISERHAQMLMRGFPPDWDTATINELGKAGQLVMTIDGVPVKIPPLPNGLFHEDPFIATAWRVRNNQQAIGNANMLQNWVKSVGETLPTSMDELVASGLSNEDAAKYMMSLRNDMMNKGLVAVPNTLMKQVNLGGVPGLAPMGELWFPPDIAAAFNANRVAMNSATDAAKLLRAWDEQARIWKKYTLGVNPGYHTRNMLGDLWNTVVLGGTDPRFLKQGYEVVSGLGAKSFKLGGRSYTRDEMLALAAKYGVSDDGVMVEAKNMLQGLEEAPTTLLGKVGQGLDENMATELSMKVGALRENGTRIGTFMDRLNRGLDPGAAAMEVKKYLFDFAELSDFERKVLRRIFPFYTWTRKNVPLQLQHLLQKPGAFSNVQSVREEAGGERGLGLGVPAPMMRFLSQGVPLALGESKKGDPQYGRLEGAWPGSDVGAVFPSAAMSRTIGLLDPRIQMGIENATRLDLFRSDFPNSDVELIERYPGQMSSVVGAPVSRRMEGNIETVAPVLGNLDRMLALDPQKSRPDVSARLLSLLGLGTYSVNEQEAEDRSSGRKAQTYFSTRGKERITWLENELAKVKKRKDTQNEIVLRRLISKDRRKQGLPEDKSNTSALLRLTGKEQ